MVEQLAENHYGLDDVAWKKLEDKFGKSLSSLISQFEDLGRRNRLVGKVKRDDSLEVVLTGSFGQPSPRIQLSSEEVLDLAQAGRNKEILEKGLTKGRGLFNRSRG